MSNPALCLVDYERIFFIKSMPFQYIITCYFIPIHQIGKSI
jgi:hypothetical protein